MSCLPFFHLQNIFLRFCSFHRQDWISFRVFSLLRADAIPETELDNRQILGPNPHKHTHKHHIPKEARHRPPCFRGERSSPSPGQHMVLGRGRNSQGLSWSVFVALLGKDLQPLHLRGPEGCLWCLPRCLTLKGTCPLRKRDLEGPPVGSEEGWLLSFLPHGIAADSVRFLGSGMNKRVCTCCTLL